MIFYKSNSFVIKQLKHYGMIYNEKWSSPSKDEQFKKILIIIKSL